MRRTLPGPDGLGIVDADGLVFLDDPPAALGCLPFERIAGQPFISRPLPHIAPKLLVTFGSFASLNSSGHRLQLIPCPGWLTISVLPQKVGAIVQNPDVGAIRH